MSFPKIKGLRWIADDFPDLVAIEVTLINRSLNDLGIEGLELPETYAEILVDLSKLAAVSPFYPKGEDEPSPIECSIDIDGVDNFVGNMSVRGLLEAWVFYKRFTYNKKR